MKQGHSIWTQYAIILLVESLRFRVKVDSQKKAPEVQNSGQQAFNV